MDSDQDGSVSPDEMKQHYKDEGVYKQLKKFVQKGYNLGFQIERNQCGSLMEATVLISNSKVVFFLLEKPMHGVEPGPNQTLR